MTPVSVRALLISTEPGTKLSSPSSVDDERRWCSRERSGELTPGALVSSLSFGTETASSSALPTVRPACTPASSFSPSWASWRTTWTCPCRRWPTTAPAWPSWPTQRPSRCCPSRHSGHCCSSSCSFCWDWGLRWGRAHGTLFDKCTFRNQVFYSLRIENAEGNVLIAVYLYACVLFA